MALPDDPIENTPYDDIRIGQQASVRRTLTRQDLHAFGFVSGDPGATSEEPAGSGASAGVDGVMAQGMWAGALISGLLGGSFPGPGTRYIEQQLCFERPVSVGDTVQVSVTVQARDDATRQVRLDCVVTNQRGETVVRGPATVQAPSTKRIRARGATPTLHLFDPEARLLAWMDGLRGHPAVRCAVVHPCDEPSLRGALEAAVQGLIEPVLVAPEARLRGLAASLGLSLAGIRVQDTAHSHASAAEAARMAAGREVDMLMKGSLHTDELMQAVLAQPGLRTARRMSHVFRFEVPAYPKPLLVTDAAINIAPNLEQKADIVANAVDAARALGVSRPKVALLSAVETVTSRLASTLDAAALCKMADRGQIAHADLEGPLAFDNAISAEAARLKGIRSTVAGDADILVVPDLEAGNMLAKQLEYLAGASSCGVVLGAQVPIALTSRADTAMSRRASAALAGVVARFRASES